MMSTQSLILKQVGITYDDDDVGDDDNDVDDDDVDDDDDDDHISVIQPVSFCDL